jgi:lysophospholipase L1-like esterase
MLRRRNRVRQSLNRRFSELVLLAVVLVLAGCSSWTTKSVDLPPSPSGSKAVDLSPSPSGSSADTLVISRNVPAYASSGTPSDANSGDYDAYWWSDTTQSWLAYDLSSVPGAKRESVLLVWYNPSYGYNHTIINDPSYNIPQDYTIDVNPAPSRDSAPTSGWVTRVTVSGNHYHSRQHLVDMQGENWIRINVTGVDGSTENYNTRIKMDIYDASSVLNDDWIFFGDSITAGSMGTETVGGVPSFAQLIHQQRPDAFPIQENGGIGYLTSADGVKYLPTWLSLFPGKYVALSYGTNDAFAAGPPEDFRQNYVTMVEDVLKAGKIPIVPHIPWGRDSTLQQNIPPLNAEIDALDQAYPQIIHGPDLWSFFSTHQDLISSDGIHPSDAGSGAYRQQWAAAMLAAIYAHQ